MTTEQGTEIRELVIDDLTLDNDSIQIRSSLKADAVSRYADSVDNLPPIVVFEMPSEDEEDEPALLVGDGFHRVAAHKSVGRPTIKAEVRTGYSMDEIREFAAVVNATSAMALTTSERNMAIRRLRSIDPKITQTEIAQKLSMSEPAVSKVMRVDTLRRANKEACADIPEATIAEVLGAAAAKRPELLTAAAEHGWTRAQMRTAVANSKDDRVSPELYAEVLAGVVEPVKPKADGTIEPVKPGAKKSDDVNPWDGVRASLRVLVTSTPETAAAELDFELVGGLQMFMAEVQAIQEVSDEADEEATGDED